MKKYSILIHHSEFHGFLKDLQDLGVVDVMDRGVEPDEETTREIGKVQQLNRVIKFLGLKVQKDTPEQSDLSALDILKGVQQSQSELDDIKQKIIGLEKQYKTLKPWGDFSPELIAKLEQGGFKLRFFVVSQRKFKPEWPSEYMLEMISESEGQSYFVIVERVGEKIEIDADEVRTPNVPAIKIKEEVDKLKERIEFLQNYFSENAQSFLPKLVAERAEIDNKISFESVSQNATNGAEDHLKIIEGWVPESIEKKVDDFLDQKGIFYLEQKPIRGEKVPILLKNGKFNNLFEPIGKLYSLPKYGELDLVPFFAPFFMLFFGFCLGDAGYGLLFMIGATLFKSRVKPEMKKVLTLLQWLGGSTIIFGALTGTFFGMNLIEMTDAGKISWLVEARKYMLDSSKMFYFALILGGIQIVYGMFIKATNMGRQFGFKYALSTIGWIILILGSVAFFALKNESNVELLTLIYYGVLGISGVLILFLNNPEKNIFVNLGGGLWDVYSIVTGVMGDLLSYIRLFALGVSSAILGYVFNDLAMQMSGDIPGLSQFFFLLIILVGHGLNIFMATLGAFVHPMRLTFVEFYKNAGFQGGGKAYNPFRHKNVN